MSASSAPSSSETEQALDTRDPAKGRIRQPPPVNNQIIPDELLVGLTSTQCNRNIMGHTAHHRHCKGCGFRRPDTLWHHQLGRQKYKYFLEQPTSLTGAGRDISFLCDAMVTQRKTTPLPPLTVKCGIGNTQNLNISQSLIPEEYHIVKSKGLQSLEFCEDAFAVYLQDDRQNLRVFPSLRPSGRLEVVHLMRMMDNMLEKAGVDQQTEELTQLSQMQGLLELVQVEQNIYNIVFHELIRQVSVGCAERGQLLAKLRQRYQLLLERIPYRLKALHTEAVAQRALDRQLAEEIYHIKTSIQKLNMELSRIREHDMFVSQQAAHAHWQLADAVNQIQSNSGMAQGYHELYELQRGRLEAQLVHLTKERDCWSKLTFCLAIKVISVKKLQLVSHLHACEHSWFKTAQQCILYLTLKDTEDLSIIMELADYWKEQLTALLSQMKITENTQFEVFDAIHQGITKLLALFTTQNKCPDRKFEKISLEMIHADLKQWSNMLVLQCERYQGEKFCCQQTVGDLCRVQESWLDKSLQLFRRHSSPDGEHSGSYLGRILSELLKQLDSQAGGESGARRQSLLLLSFVESWLSKLSIVICQPEMMTLSDWLKLEKALHNWQGLANDSLQNVSTNQKENQRDKTKPDIYSKTENVLEKVQDFITGISGFTDGETYRLSEEVASIHMAQTCWMSNLLLLMVPDHIGDWVQEPEINISWQTLDEDARILAEKLDYFSRYITSFCSLILEDQNLQNPHQAESENQMNECRKLELEAINWKDTCTVLLSGLKGGLVELPVRKPPTIFKSNMSVSQSDSKETLVNEDIPTEPTKDSGVTEVKDETQGEARDGEVMGCETLVVKLIDYDGNITQRNLGESSFHLHMTDALVVSPVTDKIQEAFKDLTTLGLLQQELNDSELRVQRAEQRALKAEEAFQAALEKIQDLERQLEPKSSEDKKKTPPPSQPAVTTPALPKKTDPEAKPTSSTKRTKKH